jgi:hypothetical protein
MSLFVLVLSLAYVFPAVVAAVFGGFALNNWRQTRYGQPVHAATAHHVVFINQNVSRRLKTTLVTAKLVGWFVFWTFCPMANVMALITSVFSWREGRVVEGVASRRFA